MKIGFRSDQAQSLYTEAVKQGWRVPREPSRSGHTHLFCPRRGCHFMVAFSISGKYWGRELRNQITLMRRHGLAWGGRPGVHTAPRLNRKVKQI